jgi:molybdate transport system permease protein
VAWACVFLLLPTVALAVRGWPALPQAIGNATALAALRLSLVSSTASTLLTLLGGTPLAYYLTRSRLPGKALMDALLNIPIVLPPSVAGIALLAAFGRRGVAGVWLAAQGIDVAFTPLAVVLAQTFVASPFYVRSAAAGFAAVDQRLEAMAATLGASPWRVFSRICIPLAAPALMAGLVMTWARSLGEFGATLLFAGSLQGRTQTLPVAVYASLESDVQAALAMSLVLATVAFAVMLLLGLVSRGSAWAPQ